MRTLSDPPEIELETNRVHSGINKEAHLTCRVQGNPEPIVSWYKDSNLLSESETVRFKTEEGRHTLILRWARRKGGTLSEQKYELEYFSSIHTGFDFGNYSCVAENSIGTFKYAAEFENASCEIDFVNLGNILKCTVDLLFQSSGLNPILIMIG